MPLGGRVVQGQSEPPGDGNSSDRQIQEAQSDGLDLEPECGEEVIIGAIAVGDPRGTEPTGDGPSPLGQDETDDQPMEPPGVSTVEMLGEGTDPSGEHAGEHNASHPSSSWGIVS